MDELYDHDHAKNRTTEPKTWKSIVWQAFFLCISSWLENVSVQYVRPPVGSCSSRHSLTTKSNCERLRSIFSSLLSRWSIRVSGRKWKISFPDTARLATLSLSFSDFDRLHKMFVTSRTIYHKSSDDFKTSLMVFQFFRTLLFVENSLSV